MLKIYLCFIHYQLLSITKFWWYPLEWMEREWHSLALGTNCVWLQMFLCVEICVFTLNSDIIKWRRHRNCSIK